MPKRKRVICPDCRIEWTAPGRGYCRPCHAARHRAWRKVNPMTPEQRMKDNARSYAHTYLRRGKIKREPCVKCHSMFAEMHHEDYSKPLEIVWLCRPCHMAHHKAAA